MGRRDVERRKILKNKLPDYLVIGQSIKNLWGTKNKQRNKSKTNKYKINRTTSF